MKVWIACLLILALAACSTLPGPPLQSAWYIQYDSDAKENLAPTLYIALLNRSTSQISITDVILNRGKEEEGSGWSLLRGSVSPTAFSEMEPGRLWVFPSSMFKRAGKENAGEWFNNACFLPVEVSVVVKSGQTWLEPWFSRKSGDPERMILTELTGRIPSSLPASWEKACIPTSCLAGGGSECVKSK